MGDEFDEFREIERVFKEIENYISRRIREAMDELYGEIHSLSSMFRPMWSHRGYLEPLYTVKDLGDEIAIYIDLPYSEEGTIDVNFVDDRRVAIRAKLKRDVSFSDWSTRFSSTRFSEYRTVIELPARVDPSRARVRVRRGVVEVLVPKA